jgi:hypothetical protein
MGSWSFRVVFDKDGPRLDEIDPAVPPGVYQVSGHDNGPEDGPSRQRAVSVVQHDPDGTAVVGATGYLGA